MLANAYHYRKCERGDMIIMAPYKQCCLDNISEDGNLINPHENCAITGIINHKIHKKCKMDNDKHIYIYCPTCNHKQPTKIVVESMGINRSWDYSSDVQSLDPDLAFKILNNIDHDYYPHLGIDNVNNLSDMLVTVLCIPPPCVHPRYYVNAIMVSEVDLKLSLVNLVNKYHDYVVEWEKANDQSLDVVVRNIAAENAKQWKNQIQFHIWTLFDNDQKKKIPVAMDKNGHRKLVCIKTSIGKDKEADWRGRVLGKRINHSCRTVITADPELGLDEVGIPLRAATELYKMQTVNPITIHSLKQMIRNGTHKWPGAKRLLKLNGIAPIVLDIVPRNAEEQKLKNATMNLEQLADELSFGDVVYRDLIDGDLVQMNRQPSLHKSSIMMHTVRVSRGKKETLTLNPNVCAPYNADFDGDEMNLYVMQNDGCVYEAEALSGVKTQFIMARSNKPVFGLIQDTQLGAYLLSTIKTQMSPSDTIAGLIYAYNGLDKLKFSKKLLKSGMTNRQFFSSILPRSLFYANGSVKIIHGELNDGALTKLHLGATYNSIFHHIHNRMGDEQAIMLFKFMTKLINWWLMNICPGTARLTDIIPNSVVCNEIRDQTRGLDRFYEQMITDIYKTTKNKTSEQILLLIERKICAHLDEIRNKYSIMAHQYATRQFNAFNNMIESGSKGNILNLTQVVALLGQQSIAGGRVPIPEKRMRTTVHYPFNDNCASARGFVANSYFDGLTPSEMFFHSMGGREGLIDTAIKTATIGYIQRRFVKFMEECTIWYDGTVRLGIHHKNQLIQLAYGFNGYNPIKVNILQPHMKGVTDEEFNTKWIGSCGDAIVEEVNELNNLRKEIEWVTSVQIPVNFDMLLFETKEVSLNTKTMGSPRDYSTRLMKFVDNLPDFIFPVKATTVFQKYILRRLTFESRLIIMDRLATNRVMNEYKLSIYQFEKILSHMKTTIMESIASPGEMVGCLAGHSLGEPAMQLTLNTFHGSGTGASTVITNSISHLNRLISLHNKPESCNMMIYNNTPTDRQSVELLANKIIACELYSLLDCIYLYYIQDGNIHAPGVKKEWRASIAALNELGMFDGDITYNPYMVEMILKPSELYRRHLTPMDIEDKLRRTTGITVISICSSELMGIVLLFNAHQYKTVEQIEKTIPHFLKTPISGIKNITQAYVINAKEKNEYCIQTVGSNLLDVMLYPNIDTTRIKTNSIHEMFKLFGQFATMNMLTDEVKGIYPMYIDPRHIKLMVECMFFRKMPLAITRYGHKAMPIGPINHSIFETPFDAWLQATLANTTDSAVSLEASTVFGQIGRFGSMMSEVVPVFK